MNTIVYNPPRPVNFGSGIQPAAQWFKSAALFLETNTSGTDFIVPTAVYLKWIAQYDSWYKRSCGNFDGRRLHLVYHREISVVGNLPLEMSGHLIEIGLAARLAGIGFSVTVDIDEGLKHRDEITALLSSGCLSSAGVSYTDATERPDDAMARQLIEEFLEAGLQMGFIGPVSYFRSIGILGSHLLNKGNITLHPRSVAPVETLPTRSHPVAPCFARFRLYIDADGFMYPCFGLLGVEGASFGSIYEDINDTVLGGKPTILDVETLAKSGPAWAAEWQPPRERLSGLPEFCERHRLELLGLGNGHQSQKLVGADHSEKVALEFAGKSSS